MNNEVGHCSLKGGKVCQFGVNCEKGARSAHVQLRLKSNKLPYSRFFLCHLQFLKYIFMLTSVHTSKFTFNNPETANWLPASIYSCLYRALARIVTRTYL